MDTAWVSPGLPSCAMGNGNGNENVFDLIYNYARYTAQEHSKNLRVVLILMVTSVAHSINILSVIGIFLYYRKCLLMRHG